VATFLELANQVKQQIMGFTQNQEQIAWLSAGMTAADTTFTVPTSEVANVSRGLVEIGDELIQVANYSLTTGVVTVAAGVNGRGMFGSTASTHAINDIITMDPDFPLQRIKEAINYTINAVYPDLYVMTTYDFPKVAARYEYEMPADAEDILRVTADTIGPSRVKFPSQTWRFNPQSQIQPASGLSTGKSLQIMDFIVPGRTVHVVYTKKPANLVNNADDYETVTGLPVRTQDVIMFGACARLLSGLEASRLQQKAVESTERAPLVPAGSASNAATYYWNLYERRLQEERDRLNLLFPSYQSFTS